MHQLSLLHLHELSFIIFTSTILHYIYILFSLHLHKTIHIAVCAKAIKTYHVLRRHQGNGSTPHFGTTRDCRTASSSSRLTHEENDHYSQRQMEFSLLTNHTYLFTYSLTHSFTHLLTYLLHGAESFLRN